MDTVDHGSTEVISAVKTAEIVQEKQANPECLGALLLENREKQIEETATWLRVSSSSAVSREPYRLRGLRRGPSKFNPEMKKCSAGIMIVRVRSVTASRPGASAHFVTTPKYSLLIDYPSGRPPATSQEQAKVTKEELSIASTRGAHDVLGLCPSRVKLTIPPYGVLNEKSWTLFAQYLGLTLETFDMGLQSLFQMDTVF
ncbi:hypothetical protein H920_05634 [Fukomys damarensis]|uniref:Uncharacterized protein n=1 Tax=Fukomys damarensis TaxID=885580 RepID=A0A091DRB2_FUKDA|nr:hypothetical protein H920_05634 [Fukomys damarensis]